MERDAFSVLLAHSQVSKKHAPASSAAGNKPNKRARSSASPLALRSGPQGSRFIECPLCGKSVHSSLAQAHVERCPPAADEVPPQSSRSLATSAGRLPVAGSPLSIREEVFGVGSSGGGVSSPSPAEAAPAVAAANTAPAPAPAEAAGAARAAVAPESAPTPAMEAAGVDTVPVSPASAPTPPPAVASSPSPPPPRPASPRPPPRARGGTNNNAFSTLMAASALSNFREEMYLWAHEDGTLSWGWGAIGNSLPPPPSRGGHGPSERNGGNRGWCCQVATKGPDGRKAGMCDIWTNLPPAVSSSDPAAGAAAAAAGGSGGGGRSGTTGPSPSGGDENAGFKAARPGQSLSRMPVAVVKSMLQKNIRRGRAEAAVRCALELALKSWSDAIRRVLVIIVEDSLLHPAAPLLTWLMVATSKGYRPPPRLLEAFLCVVHETAACPVRDSTDSCRRPGRRRGRLRNEQDPRTAGSRSPAQGTAEQQQQQQQLAGETKTFDADEFAVPHPKSLLVSAGGRGDAAGREGGSGGEAAAADAAVANIRRALLMRVSYGGMACDQALLKGACLAWGERCGHYEDCSCGNPACRSASSRAPAAAVATGRCGDSDGAGAARGDAQDVSPLGRGLEPEPESAPVPPGQQPPKPPTYPTHLSPPPGAVLGGLPRRADGGGALPFGYAHESVLSALEGNGWTAFLAAAHRGTGMPPALRSHLMAHVAGGGNEGASGGGSGGERTGKDAGRRAPGKGGGKPSGDDSRQGGARRGGEREPAGAARIGAAGPPAGRLGPVIREADAILSGVDFHCSGVLDELLRSTAVAARVGAAIQRRRGNGRQEMQRSSQAAPAVDAEKNNGVTTATTVTGGGGGGCGSAEEVVGVRQAAKRAMWARSGGLNVRRLRVAFSSEGREQGCRGGGSCRHGDDSEPAGCCRGGCWSSPGVLEESAEAGVGAGDGDFVSPEDGLVSPDMDTRVWAAMSSDVLSWTRRYVKGRLARG